MKKCYSIDGEDFSEDSLEDAAESAWNRGGHSKGDVITLWEADAVTHKASRFVPDIADGMLEQAYDVGGEWADTWDFSKTEKESLQAAVEKLVDEWADANNMQPTFYAVENSTEFKVRFTDDEAACEVVPENDQTLPPKADTP